MTIKLTELQLDALREIGNIGAGNAATSLSQLLEKRIEISVPQIKVLSISQLTDLLGEPNDLVSVVFLEAKGPFSGNIFLVFSMDEATKLLDMLLGPEREKETTPGAYDELAQSALKELGNISAGAYLSALAKVVGSTVLQSAPFLETDKLKPVLDKVVNSIGLEVDYAIVIETEFEIDKNIVKGYFLFLLESEGLHKLLAEFNV